MLEPGAVQRRISPRLPGPRRICICPCDAGTPARETGLRSGEDGRGVGRYLFRRIKGHPSHSLRHTGRSHSRVCCASPDRALIVPSLTVSKRTRAEGLIDRWSPMHDSNHHLRLPTPHPGTPKRRSMRRGTAVRNKCLQRSRDRLRGLLFASSIGFGKNTCTRQFS